MLPRGFVPNLGPMSPRRRQAPILLIEPIWSTEELADDIERPSVDIEPPSSHQREWSSSLPSQIKLSKGRGVIGICPQCRREMVWPASTSQDQRDPDVLEQGIQNTPHNFNPPARLVFDACRPSGPVAPNSSRSPQSPPPNTSPHYICLGCAYQDPSAFARNSFAARYSGSSEGIPENMLRMCSDAVTFTIGKINSDPRIRRRLSANGNGGQNHVVLPYRPDSLIRQKHPSSLASQIFGGAVFCIVILAILYPSVSISLGGIPFSPYHYNNSTRIRM